ncbi:hypothetical protein AB6A40_006441 [Gnathostoma spinigerum]|uniref:Uncharacterized protein n=1 Tax=Gnathostoma spinigerum TaxID=75299 RepID=A0ABD6ET66_9BILA
MLMMSYFKDAVNGRTLLHYAIERMEPELIEFLKSCLDHNTLLLLSEKRDLSGETALRFLTNRMSVYDAHLRHTLYASLASICRTNNEIDQTILATSGALNY